ncbi:MAG: hypothetical protein HDQ88_09080 [Clostridia bacterium]|nr:hypothetical protein [Clostridia bacterium]
MDKKQPEEVQEEQVNIRHTITAEETFTLAKDVFDLRCFIKNVYANRAVIARRLNILTLTVSTVFMLLYSAYVLITGLTRKLGLEFKIVLYVLLGAYVLLFIALIVISLCGARAGTKGVIRVKRTLAVFKLLVRLLSIAISITAIVLSKSSPDASASSIAVDILIIIFSVITIIVQLLPLLFGGMGKLVRWLLSPVKIKHRFSKVILEWYELAVSGTAKGGAVKKVSSKYFEEIGTLIDTYLIPALGKKYINSIKPALLLNVVDRAKEQDRPVLEGILNNVFSYATECGYVAFDPCKDLNFEGTVEVEEKPPKPTLKGRLFKFGTKIGKNMLDKYIAGSVEEAQKQEKK